MSTAVDAPISGKGALLDYAHWWLFAAGLLVMYVPTAVSLFTTVWAGDEQAHGPIIFTVCAWLLYRKRHSIFTIDAPDRSALGWPILAIGFLAYLLGRSQTISLVETASLIPVLAGGFLTLGGRKALRGAVFPLFFLIFMVPLPGVVVQAITLPLKSAVSYVSEVLLYKAGYPIARSGVVLSIGQYQLLVADACAGMHSMFTLEALGLLYMNLLNHTSVLRNSILAVLIVPISFCANVIRVIVLVLITFYFGDAAGQGFMHGFAGMVLFLTALVLIIGVDTLIGRLSPFAKHQQASGL